MKSRKGALLLNICGIFYAVLCVFSIVTGLMYAVGHRELNPIELSPSMLKKLSDPEQLQRFSVTMGWVTFVVGILQGISSFALFKKGSKLLYWIPFGFTMFSLLSVGFKIIGKFSFFALSKTLAYIAILIVMLLPSNRKHFLN